MSVQDKVEHILKNIHLLFSASKPYDQAGEWIIVEKNQVFGLLEQLNLAIYEVMDQYEMTSQKHELAQRRCEKRESCKLLTPALHSLTCSCLRFNLNT